MNVALPPLITLKPLSWQSALAGLCLVIGYLNIMLALQPLTTISLGRSWDGYYYYQMADHANLDGFYYRFLFRFGLPWLAGVFPTQDIFVNFKIINVACALLYTACCYFILVRCSNDMHPAVPIIGWCLICMGNLSPIPSVLWCPVQTDIVCSLFALLFLIMIITGRLSLWAVALLFFAGTTVRENFPEFLMYGLLRMRCSYDGNKAMVENLHALAEKNRTILAVLVTGFLASILGLYSIFLYTGHNPFDDQQSFTYDISSIFMNNINHPIYVLSVVTNAISPLLFIVLANVGARHPVPYSRHLYGMPFALWIIALTSFIALIGGTNPERYLYWSMPFYVLCLLPAIHSLIADKRYLVLALCILWALFIQRALVPIDAEGIHKDCGLLSILNGHSNWMGHWSDQCSSSAQKNLVELAAVITVAILLLAVSPRLCAVLKSKTS